MNSSHRARPDNARHSKHATRPEPPDTSSSSIAVALDDCVMALAAADEARVDVYFDSLDRHVERWRQEGGRWEPFDGEVPIVSMQGAALGHRSAKVRRHALGVLDHAANDVSTATFRAALADPVPKVRLVALHGLSCEQCRIGELCVEDVVSDVLRTLRDDTSATVRHAAIDVLARFMSRDQRIAAALLDVAGSDADDLLRLAAAHAATGARKVWSRKAVRRRHGSAAQRTAGRQPNGLSTTSE